MHFARSSRAVKVGGLSLGWRGAGVPCQQRCAIRVTYARNAVKGHWRAHGRYIARESAAAGGAAASGFDQQQHGIDVPSTLERWQAAQDPRLWKIIISPEFGERLDLTRLTRDLMDRIEKDQHMPLEWVAVAHFNTEHPHVHVALRGVGRNGEELRLARDYVKAGVRSIAEDLCTRQLGHRTEMDAIEAERREIREKRFTSLDRMILRKATPGIDESFWTIISQPTDGRAGRGGISGVRQQHTIARLLVLEEMGLARSSEAGAWSLHPDLEVVLRAMQRTADRQKTLRSHGVLLSDERLPMHVFDLRQTASVEGRVVVHGEDEQSGRRYLMLEGVDARVHYVEYTPEMEKARARGGLRTNAFLRLRRVLINEEPAIAVDDLGNSESLLKNRSHFDSKARELLRQGVAPVEQGWGGWLGKYQCALTQAATAVEQLAPRRDKVRERSRSKGR